MTTKAEMEWMSAITRLGCIVCRLVNFAFSPACPHHMLSGGKRIGHLWTIPLCDPGHHQNAPKESGKISRHPFKARFEAEYGTEEFLLAKTKELINRAPAALFVDHPDRRSPDAQAWGTTN